MNTFWLKVGGAAVGVLVIIVAVGVFTSSENSPAPAESPAEQEQKPKTVYDVWEKDEERLKAEPEYNEPPKPSPPTQPSDTQQSAQLPQPTPPPKPKFRELSFEEKVEAERLLEWALNERKLGRLSMGPVRMGYKKMVDHCREIIQRWPGTEYEFKARRMLADIPERYHKMYGITADEINLGNLR
ncbi:MAG: hypothetical protein JSU70_00160 [Phycisphaerales bacterium]|nr:MAG: hypothetical protein JSU70_00160 [Phycisphaerales bacterium]